MLSLVSHIGMQTGELTVSGKGSASIPLSGRPREVSVRFKHDHHPFPPCDHHDHDKLSHRITFQDEDPREHRRLNHVHHDRLFFLLIEWDVHDIREVVWVAVY
jgi:hypothetical protein